MANTIISSMSVGNSAPRCMKVTQHLGYGGPVINGLKINSTTLRPITLAGTIGWHMFLTRMEHETSSNNELPFLMPKSTIIIRFCTEKDTALLSSVFYHIEDSWILNTDTGAPLASNEIYTEKEIEELSEHIMFSIERPTELYDLARSSSRQRVTSETVSIYNLIDEKPFRRIGKSTINHKLVIPESITRRVKNMEELESNVLTIVSTTASRARASNKSDILTTKKPHLDHPVLTRNLCIILAIQSKTEQQKRAIYSKSLSEL
ncbi:hypothetical protein V1477_004757 [Vespula maculifrons]|uniref:Uncharacterized protein n=1 Tax=Vespula maculifrons TaxID=7453 RepID=A0ABD2CMQ5_VESMC